MKSFFVAIIFRIWYWYISTVDKNADVLFMNYGFHEEEEIELESHDQPNRYSIQLYHHLAKEVDLRDKDVVEVGCGRGGGLSYVFRRFSTASATGVDLSKRAISFCNKFHATEGLSFLQGDAQKLNLEDNSCDVLINVESSHRYPDMNAFLSEVNRVLRPGGVFLFTDFRLNNNFEDMKAALTASGMTIIKERNINREVRSALDLDNDRRQKLVEKYAPRFLRKTAMNFAGNVGTQTYKRISDNEFVYFSYVLKKELKKSA